MAPGEVGSDTVGEPKLFGPFGLSRGGFAAQRPQPFGYVLNLNEPKLGGASTGELKAVVGWTEVDSAKP